MITIPTLVQLRNGIINDLQTAFGSNIPLFGKVFLRALAEVQAAKLWLFYKALGNVQKNIFIDTADPESSGGTLERFGRIKLGRDPFPAQAGQYITTVTGEIGATIPAQSTFKSNDDSVHPGKMFTLDTPFTFVASSGSITLRALQAGSASRLAIGDELTLTAPIADVDNIGTVAAELDEPLDAEEIEAYRQKGIEAYQLEPNGGAASDYRIWAADAQGVAKVYPYAKTGAPGEINLFVEATEVDSIDGMGTPSGTLLTEVAAVVEQDPDTTKPLNERGRRPITAIVNTLAVTIREVDIQIEDFEGLTAPIQAEIFTAIKTELATVRPFIAGADVLENRNNIFDTNKIISIILTVRPGSTFGDVNLLIDGIQVNSFTFIDGNIPHLNTIIYP